ncbi:glycoside hydrolase family 6 protein [Pseudobacteriovorax antillogorgiicola]|uniref:Glucanase n=1 Tax=Pseudobacteriovorax antillogorgiicola TaxID=1513793 RepID=A0A1Y6CH04_9BACT|nr:glycoside hydrolase family 6 protein [Pseudobacteriovorax antillogorgiicola]TCS46978.1 cellulase/cellobiase CelA1 [Pseudobacteriovorax antillogorgiicola]SMF64708.1 Cellulase/cellobiase CelA1 [Pseudobacteriovorax antillogorgiicola]
MMKLSMQAMAGITLWIAQLSPDAIAKERIPFQGANAYLNPGYSEQIDKSLAIETDASLYAKMESLKQVPTTIWLESLESIVGNKTRMSLEDHLVEAARQQEALATDGKIKPMTVQVAIYNLPDRDCSALASNGKLKADEGGLEIYKREFIDVIADHFADPRFANLRIVAIIEPDSLPNMVTNLSMAPCQKVNQDKTYESGIQYALQTLSQLPNMYLYLDIAHSGWLGWDTNLGPAVTYYSQFLSEVAGDRFPLIDGFISNVSGYTPVEEEFLPDSRFAINYQQIRSADFYEWNLIFDERDFASELKKEFVKAGFPESTQFLIDTSRNGWGGPNRPLKNEGPYATPNEHVDALRIDKRPHRGSWCNADGAGIGARPQVLPYGEDDAVTAFIWGKPPGESDGTSDSSQTGPDYEGKQFDPMCSPTYVTGAGNPTGAMDDAPSAGTWFPRQFKMLIENAYPPIEVK